MLRRARRVPGALEVHVVPRQKIARREGAAHRHGTSPRPSRWTRSWTRTRRSARADARARPRAEGDGGRDAPRPTPWRGRRGRRPRRRQHFRESGAVWQRADARGAESRRRNRRANKIARFAPAGSGRAAICIFLIWKNSVRKKRPHRELSAPASAAHSAPRWFGSWRLARRALPPRDPAPFLSRDAHACDQREPTIRYLFLLRGNKECVPRRSRSTPPPPTRADLQMATTVFEPGVTRRECRPRRRARDARAGRAGVFARTAPRRSRR